MSSIELIYVIRTLGANWKLGRRYPRCEANGKKLLRILNHPSLLKESTLEVIAKQLDRYKHIELEDAHAVDQVFFKVYEYALKHDYRFLSRTLARQLESGEYAINVARLAKQYHRRDIADIMYRDIKLSYQDLMHELENLQWYGAKPKAQDVKLANDYADFLRNLAYLFAV